MDISKLDELYRLYRFQVLPISNSKVRIYSYTSKYYSNADVIPLNSTLEPSELDKLIKEISSIGYSVQLRNYKTIEEAEDSLFDGFFDIKTSKLQLADSYRTYKRKNEDLIFSEYEYINSEYVDNKVNLVRNDNIIGTILSDLKKSGPVLIMIEAAAGFGKTSTSYEILRNLVEDETKSQIPLLTELSRNRQASIFKYVLYDEINAKFAGPSLELVNKHIIDGRIPVIIDGFDELLKTKSKEITEDRFEDAEPMLETIKELLKGEAKIILTTRRTAIFSDDEFSSWIDNNENEFYFAHYGISEPTIKDWIPAIREKQLQKVGLNLKSIANPVLLSYLRGMNEEEFSECLSNIDLIIDNYIRKLMDREMQRQDLLMSVDEQKQILKTISEYFTQQDITAESREIIEKKLIQEESKLLLAVLERYPAAKKPTIDQLINKLVIHAFLDKKGDTGHQIGFVNEFILGSFVGENLLDEKDNWLGTDRFLDFLLTSYIPRESTTKREIYNILNVSILDMLSPERRIYVDNYLYGCINRNLDGAYIPNMEFRNAVASDIKIENTIFSDCEFYEIDFNFSKISNTFFINCRFFDCQFEKDKIIKRGISFTNCESNVEEDTSIFELKDLEIESEGDIDLDYYERKVLEKFWPTGKDRFFTNKRPGTLRMGVPNQEIHNIDIAISTLIKKGILVNHRGHWSLELNINEINEIKRILRR